MRSLTAEKTYLIVGLTVLVLITAPYLFAVLQGGSDHQFAGFLLNPKDGNTYLAKMYQGWSGEWRFTLPYTAEAGKGAYLFLFYLFLGHVARGLNLPLLLVFHLFRIACSVLMLGALAHFFHRNLPSGPSRKAAFTLSALGSGLGWLAIPFGAFTMDLWVAEAYPLLAMYSNPHFPLALALLLYLLPPKGAKGIWLVPPLSLLLSLISPFAIVLLLLIRTGAWVMDLFQDKPQPVLKAVRDPQVTALIWIGIFGVPMLIYQFWVVRTDPILAGWNAQNITPSPPIWNSLISLSPAFLVGLLGLGGAWKGGGRRVLVMWLVIGGVLSYLPWSLQRRFFLGYYIPVAGLAVFGLQRLGRWGLTNKATLFLMMLILSVPSNVVVIASGLQAVNTHQESIYLRRPEALALEWIEGHTSTEALILASPDMGSYIPAYTGRRVLYGHPFETTDAEEKIGDVTAFYAGDLSQAEMSSFLATRDVDYILVGPREREVGQPPSMASFPLSYRSDGVKIYRVEP